MSAFDTIKNKLARRRSRKIGMSPGSLVHVGKRKAEKSKLTACLINADRIEELSDARLEDILALKVKPGVLWVNLDGLHDVETLQALGSAFGVHPLALEDVANTEQRPKCDEFETTLFAAFKIVSLDAGKNLVQFEHACIVLGKDFVLSFQEGTSDDFDAVRERMKSPQSRMRKAGADYLAYALVDYAVDRNFAVLEAWGDQLSELDQAVLTKPTPSLLNDLHRVRSEMLVLRKNVWPLREVLTTLQRYDGPLINAAAHPYLRDVYDHVVEIIDTLEALRDMAKDILDSYLSLMSFRANEIMKSLTLMAAIFIPLTFIVGVYGMNFDYMPELRWHYGYHAVWAVMIAVGAGLAWYFGRKKWL